MAHKLLPRSPNYVPRMPVLLITTTQCHRGELTYALQDPRALIHVFDILRRIRCGGRPESKSATGRSLTRPRTDMHTPCCTCFLRNYSPM